MADREALPYIDLLNNIGLNTKSSNEIKTDQYLIQADNTDFFRKYGATSKCFGSSRVLSSVYTEGGTARKISWVGFWKNISLNGQLDRQTLCAAGTKLHKLNTDGTLTALTGSGKTITENWIEGLVHMHQKAGDLMFITNQDPALIGNGNTLVKYDGLEITRWGLLAPGEEVNINSRVTTVGAAPPVGPNNTWIPTNGTAVADSITTLDGAAISVTKTSTGATNAYIEQTLSTPLIGHNAHGGVVRLGVFIPLGELIKLSPSSAVVIKATSDIQVSSGITIPDFSTNNYTWTIPIGQLFEGWNYLELGFSTTSTDLAFDQNLAITGSPTISALTGWRLGFNSTTNGILPAGIRFSKLQSFTRGNVTATEGASGSVFTSGAVYSYKITFVSKQGAESNAGPQSSDITTTADRANISLTNVPVSADPQIIARKIYRTVAGGSLWIFVDRIDDNVTTTYSDVLADEALGSLSPPEAGDVSSDNGPPPDVGIIKFYKRTMFGAGDPASPNTLYWSNPDDVEGWPTLNTAQLDAPITAIYETYSSLIVETDLGKWQVLGDNPDFTINKIINNIGCVGRRAAGETRILGWAIDRDGMRLYDANTPIKISEAIRDKFDNFTKTYLELTHSMHSKNNNAIIMCVPGSTQYSFNADNYVFQYPVDEIGQGWWWKLNLPSSVNILDLEEIEDADGDFHVYFGSTDGMIYELFDFNAKSFATATSSEAITTTFATKWFRLGELGKQTEGVSGRTAPRFIEVIAQGDPCTWTLTINTATGPVQSSATDSVSVPVVFGSTKETMMRYPISGDLQPGEYISITAQQATSGVDSQVLALRLYSHVQPGQFPIETGAFGGLL